MPKDTKRETMSVPEAALAEEDLDRWRSQKGDRAILRAVEKAQELGLYRNCLLDFMENTYPARRRGAA